MSGVVEQDFPLVCHATQQYDPKRKLYYTGREDILIIEHLQMYNSLRIFVDEILAKHIEWKLAIILPEVLNLTCNKIPQTVDEKNNDNKTSATAIILDKNVPRYATNEMYEYLQRYATEATIIRYMIGSDYRLEIGKLSLLEVVQWRITSNIDNLTVEQFRTALEQNVVYCLNETDIEGHFIGYINVLGGRLSPWVYIKGIIWLCEKARRIEQLKNKEVNQLVALFNMEKVQYSAMPPFMVIKQMGHVLKYYYPERMARTFILFAPWVCRLIWKVIQTQVPENTKGKIIFPGWYESKEYSTFSKYIAKDKLLKKFGGTSDMEYSYEWELQTSLENNHYFPIVDGGGDDSNINNNNNNVRKKEAEADDDKKDSE